MAEVYARYMIVTAYLRVYLPSVRVAGLPPHRGINARRGVQYDGDFMWTEPTADDAIYTEWNGLQFACPRNTRLRMLEGIVALSRTDWGSPLVADDERRASVVELDRLRRATKLGRSHILTNAWHIPLRWFSAFHPSEREIYNDSDVVSIRYRTNLGAAIDRVRWAENVLEAAGFADEAIEHVRQLATWLAEFTADCMLELDYGRVATLFPEADLVFDESALDVRNSLLALESGEFEDSSTHYERVVRRWSTLQAYTYSN